MERMFEVAEREFGEIDIVCPGAGVYELVRNVLEKPICTLILAMILLKICFMFRTGAASGFHLDRLPAKTRLLVVGTL